MDQTGTKLPAVCWLMQICSISFRSVELFQLSSEIENLLKARIKEVSDAFPVLFHMQGVLCWCIVSQKKKTIQFSIITLNIYCICEYL